MRDTLKTLQNIFTTQGESELTVKTDSVNITITVLSDLGSYNLETEVKFNRQDIVNQNKKLDCKVKLSHKTTESRYKTLSNEIYQNNLLIGLKDSIDELIVSNKTSKKDIELIKKALGTTRLDLVVENYTNGLVAYSLQNFNMDFKLRYKGRHTKVMVALRNSIYNQSTNLIFEDTPKGVKNITVDYKIYLGGECFTENGANVVLQQYLSDLSLTSELLFSKEPCNYSFNNLPKDIKDSYNSLHLKLYTQSKINPYYKDLLDKNKSFRTAKPTKGTLYIVTGSYITAYNNQDSGVALSVGTLFIALSNNVIYVLKGCTMMAGASEMIFSETTGVYTLTGNPNDCLFTELGSIIT